MFSCFRISNFFFLLCYLFSSYSLSGQSYTISGYINDGQSGETLINAALIDNLSLKGTVSNNYGYYSLSLPAGVISLAYSYVGYDTYQTQFELRKDTVININLTLNNALEEVTVIGHRTEMGVRGSQMSAVEVPIAQIRNIPSLLGETDLIKALQLLPGVQSGTEGAAGMYVRGGGPDENLLMLDGVPVYNVNHLFGFFSVFNTDALKNVTLYKGSFPARFGERLSSVVDIRMKDGDDKKFHGNASIGLIASKINIEGPIWKERTTFNISARRTYIDILAQPFIKMAAREEYGDGNARVGTGYYFYDVNAKFTHRFSDKDRLFLSAYIGDDAVYSKIRTREAVNKNRTQREWMSMDWDWGNLISALRWNHVLSNKLFMNTTVSYTRYRSLLNVGNELETTFDANSAQNTKEESALYYHSGIRDWTAKVDFDYLPNPSHNIKFGAGYTYHTFSPDVTSFKEKHTGNKVYPGQNNVDTIIGNSNVYAHETIFYAEDNVALSKIFKANIGARFSMFNVQNKGYYSFEPRLSFRALLSDKFSVKAGYAAMSQYIHLLSNNNINLPTDLWVPATKQIEPMTSKQYSIGAFYSIANIAELSLEGYYKDMNNLVEYKDGASFFGQSSKWEEKLSMGRGWAYGVEFLAQRSFGNTTGWIGYTWSKTQRVFDRKGEEINGGRVFPAKYDRRHDFSITASHKFSEKMDVSATWVFSTGNAASLGLSTYQGTAMPNELHPSTANLTHIESRNNFRYNNYHRLDLGINFHKKRKRYTRTWNISVYNAYNNFNPFFVYAATESNGSGSGANTRNILKQATLFPIIPSVSYSIKF